MTVRPYCYMSQCYEEEYGKQLSYMFDWQLVTAMTRCHGDARRKFGISYEALMSHFQGV